jgi:guanylate kinase
MESITIFTPMKSSIARFARNEFLEWAESAGNRYGTPRKAVEDSLRPAVRAFDQEIEISGAKQVKAKVPESILVFFEPPTWEDRFSRLEGRGTDQRRTSRCSLRHLLKKRWRLPHSSIKVLINDGVEAAGPALIEFASA